MPRKLAAASGAELVWLEEGSHFAHVDAPDAFVAAILSFLLGDGARER